MTGAPYRPAGSPEDLAFKAAHIEDPFTGLLVARDSERGREVIAWIAEDEIDETDCDFTDDFDDLGRPMDVK